MNTNGCFGSSSAGSHMCPRSLDCARAGRHFCQLGSSSCGPCLHPLVENPFGRCVVKRRHAPHTAPSIKGKWKTFTVARYMITVLCWHCRARPDSQLFSAALLSALTLSPTSFQSGIMSSFRPAQRSHLLTVCLYFFSVMSSVFIVAGSLALIIAAACWISNFTILSFYDLTELADFLSPGDKKLAHSAQMYHYQHQKQQMLSFDKDEPKVPDSGASTDEENEDGDFTVYECPGLAPEMDYKCPIPAVSDSLASQLIRSEFYRKSVMCCQ
uniref:Neural proliferation, differentiation and control, 1b n=1 Tax=Amphiprion percula TaxID=161767 RepID=A0A3P8T244_AMPPE